MSISNWRLHPTFGISDIQSVAEQRNQTEKNVDAMRLIRKKYTKLGLWVNCAEWMCAERWFIWLDWVFATMKYCLILFRLVSTTWRWWLIAVISYNDDSLCDGATFCLHSIPLHTKMPVLVFSYEKINRPKIQHHGTRRRERDRFRESDVKSIKIHIKVYKMWRERKKTLLILLLFEVGNRWVAN